MTDSAGAGRTYWHLGEIAAGGRPPSDYEIATTRLHYYVGRGFEVALPMGDWYRRFQSGSPLTCEDWDRFSDPRQTTYALYVALQQAREAHVDAIFAHIDETDGDRRLAPGWMEVLDRLLAPMRYLGHGLQMLAAYVGQMAPGSRLTVVAALQAADEMRRVDRLAYRVAQLRRVEPALGAGAKARWLSDPGWQPARRLVERLLVAYDWGEAFAGLNLCAKPILDGLLMLDVAGLGDAEGDGPWREIAASLHEDCAWHAAWSEALVGVALAAAPGNGDAIRGFVSRWWAPAEEAALALAPLAGAGGDAAAAAAIARGRAWLQRLGAWS